LKELDKDFDNINYTVGITRFSQFIKSETYLNNLNTKCISSLNHEVYGTTALYDAVGKVITDIRSTKKSGDKVLLKIFTDGGENASKKYTASHIKEMIQSAEAEGFTVTFVGTEGDINDLISRVGVRRSNTMSHDNSMESIQTAFVETRSRSVNYSKKVSKGLSVKEGFYKGI
jgi:folate-binding Fe-S cluster repair protein YgfZ